MTEDGWEAHRREQLRTQAAATPAQRLEWLEAAIEFAFAVGALPRRETHDDPWEPKGEAET